MKEAKKKAYIQRALLQLAKLLPQPLSDADEYRQKDHQDNSHKGPGQNS